jgi:ribosomal-protein-alanine N-acetyltransferase
MVPPMPWYDIYWPWTWWFAGDPVVVSADAGDASDCADIHARAFRRGWGPDEFERLLADRAVTAHRLDLGRPMRATAGFVLSRRAADEAEILSVAVHEGWRGKGLGRKLLDHHMGRLAATGIKSLFLEVEAGNDPALALYRGAGFREVARRPGYYGGGKGEPKRDALVLHRDLR